MGSAIASPAAAANGRGAAEPGGSGGNGGSGGRSDSTDPGVISGSGGNSGSGSDSSEPGGSGRPGIGPGAPGPPTVNQSDLSPSFHLASSPEPSTVRAVPTTLTRVTRPPSAPRLLRPMTSKEISSPTPYAFAMAPAVTVCCQLRFGETTSPSSTTAGKTPPAVNPPDDDENSAAMIWLPRLMTVPLVVRTASVVRQSSLDDPR